MNINIGAQSFNDQDYHLSYIDVSSGLSNNYVRNMVEDDFGFKWIATEGGLNRYDGKSFQTFKPSNTPALRNENIEVVFKDGQGDLWIGTKSGGLTHYDSRHQQFKNLNDGVFASLESQTARVTTIAEDQHNRIFVGTWSNGLFVFDKDSVGRVEHHFKGYRINEVVRDNYGNIWITRWNQLFKYDPSETRFIQIGTFGNINGLCNDAERNRLWLGSSHSGLGFINLNDHSFHQLEIEGLSKVESLKLDNEGRLFVGTWGSGLFISDTTASVFNKYSLLPTDTDYNNTSYEAILDIHLDDNGIIWVSTAFGGIVKLMPVNSFGDLEGYVFGQELADKNIYSMEVDQEGRTWMGTYGAGVSLLDGQVLTHLTQLPISKVNVFLAVENTMLIGTREGLFAVSMHDPEQGFQHLFPELNLVTSLLLSRDGKLWIGTQQNGLYYASDFSPADVTQDVSMMEDWSHGDRISRLIEDAKGNVWIGTFNGLRVYHAQQDRFIRGSTLSGEQLPSDIINDLYLDEEDGKLWVALSGGLVELNVDGAEILKVSVNGTDKGLKNEFITSIIKVSDDQIWVGTANGLAKYLTGREVFENYGKYEGVPVQSFNIKCADQLKDGRLIFGAADGLVAFDPQQITFHQADPEVLFTGLKINGESVNVGEEINGKVILQQSLQHTADLDLSYKDEAFSFQVSTLDYLGDDNVLFSYRLVGFNDNWSQLSTNREIRYINLNPGDYRMEVKASRDSFHWSSVAYKNIHISTPIWSTWYAYLFYIVVVLGFTYLINYIANRQANLQANLEVERIAREKEHDLSEAKITFFTNISHEFRTPLTLIISPITELLMDQQISERIRERLITIEKNASRLLQLINQLLDFRKSENGLLQLRVAHGDLNVFAKEVFLSFKAHASARKIKYTFDATLSNLVLPFDRDKMEIVLVNLLSNAFKYTPEGGKIQVKIEESGTDCCIQVIDNGPGIQPEQLHRVFDRFYQIHSAESAKILGSGIGLSLTKNIIELHHGNISVKSTPMEETVFTILLPIDNPGFQPKDYIDDFRGSDDRVASPEYEQVATTDFDDEKDSDREIILVVDDNIEIRSYLSVLIQEEGYQVISASNGLEALSIANEQHPDLVISDIMMPEMDGITLCSTLKNDVNTSHIPVILLTARTSTVYEVSGLETGADDYIKKPFHPAVVKTRVSNLLHNRRKIRKYFVNKLRFKPSEQMEALGAEEQFIQKAITLIEDHIHDASFGIENLMDSLAMSKSTLYRKLKSLTGLSITGFIRSVKLKKSAELILTKDWKLNQIAYESGFNDYKYFKNCFQEQFGCLPSEYRTKHPEETSEEAVQ